MAVTIPPDTRAAGTGNPPVDMDDVADVLNAWGIGYNVQDTQWAGGADPTGAADSTAAINAANAAAAGAAAFAVQPFMPPGTYKTTAPLVIPPGVKLRGPGLFINVQTYPFGARGGAVITPSSGFSGTAVISVPDQATGGWSVPAANSGVEGITIDGSSLPGTTDGIQVYGSVFGCVIDKCNIFRATGWGINAEPNGANFPDLLKIYRTIVNFNSTTGGVQLSHCPDSTCEDVYVLGGLSGGPCWSVTPSGNTHLTDCRAENTGAGPGYYINGNAGYGQVSLANCSSNLIGQDAVVISGTGSVIITGGYHYGAGQSGSGYSIFKITGQAYPVIISGVNTTPAVNGSSVNGPTNGLSVLSSSAHILVSDSLIWGASAALNDDGSNSDIHIGPNCAFVTGTQGSPAFTYPGLQVTETGSVFTTAVNAASAAGEMFTVTNATAAPANASTMLFAKSAGDKTLGIRVSGEANSRLDIFSTGALRFGAGGSSATDTDLYRNAAGELKTDQSMTVADNLTVGGAALAAGGAGVMGLVNAATAPSGSPAGGGILYGAGGQPYWLDSGGTTWQMDRPAAWTAQEMGYAAMAYDLGEANFSSRSVPTAGVLYLIGMWARAAKTISTAQVLVGTNGSALTTGNLVGVYSSAGVLLGYSADQTTAWGTGTVPRSASLSLTAESSGTLALTPAYYWVGILVNGTGTLAGFESSSNVIGTVNGQLTAASYRYATNGSGLTALPASFTPGSNVSAQISFWAGVY